VSERNTDTGASGLRTAGAPSTVRGAGLGSHLLVVTLAALIGGCGDSGGGQAADRSSLELVFEPSPPHVGLESVGLLLADASGAPLENAAVRLEGNMNHAGMVPEFADATEVEPGHYMAELEFTMGGDWILSVEATLPGGETLHWRKDVRGVRVD